MHHFLMISLAPFNLKNTRVGFLLTKKGSFDIVNFSCCCEVTGRVEVKKNMKKKQKKTNSDPCSGCDLDLVVKITCFV